MGAMAFVLVPPLAAVLRKRNMHHALLVPEILLIIFKNVTDDSGQPLLQTLVAIASTCRLFQQHVEGILWYNLPNISALYNILPLQVRNRESQSWSLNRRMFCGPRWKRFMDRASRVRILNVNSVAGQCEQCSTIFLAIAALRDPLLLTPNLRELVWKTDRHSIGPAINLFLGPSLTSLEIEAKLFTERAIHMPLGDTCPKLEHLKITGNGRSAAGIISNVLCGLHYLKTVTCSTLDDDAFVHLAQLKHLSYLAVDMRWSILNFDTLRDRIRPDGFHNLQTLYWKDYDLGALADISFMPSNSLTDFHLEIETFCTSSSLYTFLQSFARKFPHTQTFSLVHDIQASRRFGLQVGAPGREHQLNACDLDPLFSLKSLRVLGLVDLGHLRLSDDLVKTIASVLPELEQLQLETNVAEIATPLVTFDGLIALLQHCPKLRSVGLCIDAEDMLSFWDTTVRHAHVTHLRLEGSVLESRRVEVDEMLRRVFPGLRTVEESLLGVTRRVRDVRATTGGKDGTTWSETMGRRTTGRRTCNSLERACSR